MNKNHSVKLKTIIPKNLAGKRLDQALSILFSDYSRARIQTWIKTGEATIDHKIAKPNYKVCTDQEVIIDATIINQENWKAQAIPLNIVYEDDAIIVINKPVGLVVHPAAGNPDKTLLNALLNHAPELACLPRAGIIHRLDKNTSGLLVIARNLKAHAKLVTELQKRKIKREYQAIVNGVMTAGGTIDIPIGRHPKNRKLMTTIESGKVAITTYRIIQKFRAHTHIKVLLQTGRTHQIRVHMAHINYSIVGDPVYGGRLKIPAKISEELKQRLQNFKHQALHASCLGLVHPITNQAMEWQASLPEDMQQLLCVLKKDFTNALT
jgi:23S rRNA pseudouridine1911/1915/1917 synthase